MLELLDFFNYQFFNRALLMSVFCGISCGIIGVWILLLNIAFIGIAMAHAAFAGALIGLLIGINPVLCAFIVCIISSVLIEPISKKSKTQTNISISILFSFLLGISFLFLSLLQDSKTNILSLIWGNILTTTNNDIIINSILTVLLILFLIIFNKGIIAILFNREISRAAGIPEKSIFYLILILCSTVISINLHSIGGLLIYGLIIIPSSCAYQFTNKISLIYLLSVSISVLSCITGLFVSAALSIPAGTSIILVLSLFFVISVLLSNKKGYII